MTEQPWLTISALCALAGLCALIGRFVLKAWSLRQLKILSRESLGIRHCWALLDQLPAELLTQPLRMTFGKIMYVRLKRAQKVRPEHPFLRDQQLQIAQLIGTRQGGRIEPLNARAREEALEALQALKAVLEESAADRIINELEHDRCALRLDEALSSLQLSHYKQAALEAEYLQRIPQAIAYLRSALHSAEQLHTAETERQEIHRHLQELESVSGF